LAGRRSRSPGVAQRDAEALVAKSKEEHDREHHAAVLACMCLAASAPAALARAGDRLHPGGLCDHSRTTSCEQWNGVAQDRDQHQVPDQRSKAFKEAERDLTQAVRVDDQQKNQARGTYLGRYYLR